LALGKQLVKVFQKGGVVAVSVVNPCVMVIAHRYGEQYVNVVALSCHR
jgi:hypothetical protein